MFLLTPIPADVFASALEDWEIWLRWSAAREAGTTTTDTHPALPKDRARHEELAMLLKSSLTTNINTAVAANAQFDFSQVDENGKRQLKVEWTRVEFDPSFDMRSKYSEEN